MVIPKLTPFYSTVLGNAYLGNSLDILPLIPNQSIDLICTSPPFALLRPKEYGNASASKYISWFLPFAEHFKRILKSQGSLIIDIGGTWTQNIPTRSLYQYELLLALCKLENGLGFHLAQELYWYNPSKLPTPAEWVTIKRIRVKDAINNIWWLSPSPFPKADNKQVLQPYSESHKKQSKKGYSPQKRPSGHNLSSKFGTDNKGSIPPNLIPTINHSININENFDENQIPINMITSPNASSNDHYLQSCRKNNIQPHPARFPKAIPEFVIKLCTEPDDIVLDPFAGSNMTGSVAEQLNRKWIAIEMHEPYLKGSKYRFENLT